MITLMTIKMVTGFFDDHDVDDGDDYNEEMCW